MEKIKHLKKINYLEIMKKYQKIQKISIEIMQIVRIRKKIKEKFIVNFNGRVKTSEEFIFISNFKQKGYFLRSALLVLML